MKGWKLKLICLDAKTQWKPLTWFQQRGTKFPYWIVSKVLPSSGQERESGLPGHPPGGTDFLLSYCHASLRGCHSAWLSLHPAGFKGFLPVHGAQLTMEENVFVCIFLWVTTHILCARSQERWRKQSITILLSLRHRTRSPILLHCFILNSQRHNYRHLKTVRKVKKKRCKKYRKYMSRPDQQGELL